LNKPKPNAPPTRKRRASRLPISRHRSARAIDVTGAGAVADPGVPIDQALKRLSLCILVLQNAYTIVGKSAPASAANFNGELGRKLAYEDAVRQSWPLMGFALCDRLAKG
jgi:hypothetical protein